MKFFIICMTMAIFGALSHAAPLGTESRPFRAHITFKGAPPEVAFFTHSFVVDGTLTRIENSLSVSQIKSDGGATCTFYGIDGRATIVDDAQTVDVGPPQTQISGACLAL